MLLGWRERGGGNLGLLMGLGALGAGRSRHDGRRVSNLPVVFVVAAGSGRVGAGDGVVGQVRIVSGLCIRTTYSAAIRPVLAVFLVSVVSEVRHYSTLPLPSPWVVANTLVTSRPPPAARQLDGNASIILYMYINMHMVNTPSSHRSRSYMPIPNDECSNPRTHKPASPRAHQPKPTPSCLQQTPALHGHTSQPLTRPFSRRSK